MPDRWNEAALEIIDHYLAELVAWCEGGGRGEGPPLASGIAALARRAYAEGLEAGGAAGMTVDR